MTFSIYLPRAYATRLSKVSVKTDESPRELLKSYAAAHREMMS